MESAKADLTDAQIAALEQDELKHILDIALDQIKQQYNLISSDADNQKAVDLAYKKLKAGAKTSTPASEIVSQVSTGQSRFAQTSPGSARIGMGRSRAGEELNALDALAAQRAVNMPVVVSDNRATTTNIKTDTNLIGETVAPARDATVYSLP